MRVFLLALALSVAAGASAQSQGGTRPSGDVQSPAGAYSPGFYVAPVVGIGLSSGGSAFLVGAAVGRQLSARTDVGVGLYGGDLRLPGSAPFAMVQPRVGLAVPLGEDLRGHAQLAGSVLAADLDTAFDPEPFGLRVLGAQAEATLSREVPIGGSFRIAPTAGAYAAVCATFDIPDRPGASCAEGGALVGAQVLFRVFGVEAMVPLVFPVRVVGDTDQASLNGAFNLTRRAIPGGVRVLF